MRLNSPVPIVAYLAGALWLAGCSRKPVTVDEVRAEAPWRVELQSVAEPAEVVARRTASPMNLGAGDLPVPRNAASGSKWVVVKLRVTAPPPESASSGIRGRGWKDIRLEGGGQSFECAGVGSSSVWKDESGKTWPEFIRGGSRSVIMKDGNGGNRLLVESDGLYFYTTAPEVVDLLFEVAAKATALRLQF